MTTRDAGWYWVQIEQLEGGYSNWVPAEWRPEANSWRSTGFSGVPSNHVIVGEKLTAPPYPAAGQAAQKDLPGVLFEDLDETSKDYLETLCETTLKEPHLQDALLLIAEMNSAMDEGRPLNQNYKPMLSLLLAAYGTLQVDIVRFAASVRNPK